MEELSSVLVPTEGHARDYLSFQTSVFSNPPSIRGNAGPDYYPIWKVKADANQTRFGTGSVLDGGVTCLLCPRPEILPSLGTCNLKSD